MCGTNGVTGVRVGGVWVGDRVGGYINGMHTLSVAPHLCHEGRPGVA